MAPVAVTASTWPRSISSMPSARSFETKPIERTATAVVARSGPFPRGVFLAAWHEERERQFAEEVPDGREVDVDQRVVRVLARMRYLRCPTRRGGGVIAYRNDMAVGYGRWRYGSDGETVFLHTAATLQPHRRTGVYTAILDWRLERAVRDGKTTAVVVAERSTSAPILMRKGFREVGAMQIWMAV